MAPERFGDLLRHYRHVVGFSQEYLAEKARMSVNAVSVLERGVRRAPHSTTLQKLAEALELSPDDTRALEEAAQGARARGQGADTVSDTSGNLPHAVTSFVGRDAEIGEIRKLVIEEGRRLVTVIGAGGVGKSRLVLETAHRMAGEFGDGVWLVALASLDDASEVGATIAKTLRIETGRNDSPVIALTRALRGRETLLILDNCEHLIEAVAEVAAALASSAPGVRVVATSRERLRLQGEVTYTLSPLACPAAGVTSADEARSYPSVDLFVQRAASVSADFAEVQDDDVATVADIVRRLDGLPLAIELAVPMVRLVGISGLAERLRDHLRLPGAGGRDLPKHHRTIDGIVAWSYQRLSDIERFVFEACSVFTGPFAVDALVDVCAQAGVAEEDTETAFAALLDKSLVAVADRRGARYMLLETIRDYASAASSRSGRQAKLRRFHAQHYLSVAEGLGIALSDGERAKNVARLESDGLNFRAALTWSLIDGGDAEIGGRLAVSLSAYLEQDTYSTSRHWYDRAAAAIDPEGAPQRWADVIITGEFFAQYGTDGLERLPKMERAVTIARELGAPRRLAVGLLWLASLRGQTDDVAGSEAAADEATSVARGEDARFLARALQINAVMVAEENHAKRRSLLTESLRVYQPLEPDIWIALRLSFLSELEFQCGNLDAALALARESVTYLDRLLLKDAPSRAAMLIVLASTALIVGDIDCALGAARGSIEIAAEMGDLVLVGVAIQPLAYAHALRGNLDVAAMLVGYSDKRTASLKVEMYKPAVRACRAQLRSLLASDPRASDLKAAEEQGACWSDDRALEVALSQPHALERALRRAAGSGAVL